MGSWHGSREHSSLSPPRWSANCPGGWAVGTHPAGHLGRRIFRALEFALICTRAGFQGTAHVLVIKSSAPVSLSCEGSCVLCQPLGLCQLPSAAGPLAPVSFSVWRFPSSTPLANRGPGQGCSIETPGNGWSHPAWGPRHFFPPPPHSEVSQSLAPWRGHGPQ